MGDLGRFIPEWLMQGGQTYEFKAQKITCFHIKSDNLLNASCYIFITKYTHEDWGICCGSPETEPQGVNALAVLHICKRFRYPVGNYRLY